MAISPNFCVTDLGEFSYYFRIWNPLSKLSEACRDPILDQSLTGPDLTGPNISVKSSPLLPSWLTRRSFLQDLNRSDHSEPWRYLKNWNNWTCCQDVWNFLPWIGGSRALQKLAPSAPDSRQKKQNILDQTSKGNSNVQKPGSIIPVLTVPPLPPMP